MYKIYQVEYGDTIDIIANKTGTTANNIKRIPKIQAQTYFPLFFHKTTISQRKCGFKFTPKMWFFNSENVVFHSENVVFQK